MHVRILRPLLTLALVSATLLSAGCANFKAPRLFDEPPPQPKIPATVALQLDDSVRTSILEHLACADTQWAGQLGTTLVHSFQEMGRARFTQFVLTETPPVQPAYMPGTYPVTATVKLAQQSLLARTKTGADDRYTAQLDLRLIATFYDAQGRPLPDAPLIYSEGVSVYTPRFAGSGSCATHELDELMKQAADQVADQFPKYVTQLIAKAQAQPSLLQPVVATPQPAPTAPTSVPVPSVPSQVVTTPATTAPTLTTSPRDSNRYAVVVGLSLYRTPWAGWRDGLAATTKESLSHIATMFQVPDDHLLLLQDELAAQEDIEEAIAAWLPKHVGKDSIVLVYFSGQALADSKTGEVSLIPYDATPASPRTRLIGLRWLQSRLQRLGAKLTLAVLDAPSASASSKDAKGKVLAPNWAGDLKGSSGPGEMPFIQVSRLPGALSDRVSLLEGLSGPADLDHDGTITLGEWLRSLRGSALTVPGLPPTVAVQSIPLARVTRR